MAAVIADEKRMTVATRKTSARRLRRSPRAKNGVARSASAMARKRRRKSAKSPYRNAAPIAAVTASFTAAAASSGRSFAVRRRMGHIAVSFRAQRGIPSLLAQPFHRPLVARRAPLRPLDAELDQLLDQPRVLDLRDGEAAQLLALLLRQLRRDDELGLVVDVLVGVVVELRAGDDLARQAG